MCLRELFTAAQLATLAGVTSGTEPTEEQKLIVLAVLNKAIQGPLIYDSERFPLLTPPCRSIWRKQQHQAIQKDNVLLANRRFVCHVFQDDLEDFAIDCGSKFLRGLAWFFGRLLPELVFAEPPWPRNQVSVSADRRFIMCDDKPLLMGENLNWNDAPIFSDHRSRADVLDLRALQAERLRGLRPSPRVAGHARQGRVASRATPSWTSPGHRIGSSIAWRWSLPRR